MYFRKERIAFAMRHQLISYLIFNDFDIRFSDAVVSFAFLFDAALPSGKDIFTVLGSQLYFLTRLVKFGFMLFMQFALITSRISFLIKSPLYVLEMILA